MAEAIDIRVDCKYLLSYFDDTYGALLKSPKYAKGMTTSCLYAVGNALKKKVRHNYGSVLTKQSGRMYKGIKTKLTRDKSTILLYSAAKDPRSGHRYSFMLGNGPTTILPKQSDGYLVLHDKDGNVFAKKKAVTVPKYDITEVPSDGYFFSQQYYDDIRKAAEKYLNKMVAKLEQQNAGGGRQ